MTNTSYHYLDNSGTIDIQHGTLQLDGNPSGGNDVFRNGTIIKGAGKLVTSTTAFCSGTITVDGTFDVSSDVRSNSDTSTVTFKGVGSLEWHGGGLGGVNIAPGFTVNASGTGGKALTTSNATNSGKPGSNAGTFNWKGGAGITIYPSYTNTGTFNVLAAGGVLGGTFTNRGTFSSFPGGVTGTGGTFVNVGIMNVGSQAKPGTFTFYGGDPAHGFSTTGTINAFIAGTKASQLQALSDANSATSIKLGGKLAIALASGTKPTAAQQFVLVKVFPNRAEYSQKFASVTGVPTVSGRAMQLFYHPMDVTLGTPLTVSGRAVRWVLSNGTLAQQGISGATVNLVKTNGATITATTSSTGNFVFKGLELGSYTASTSKSGITFDPLSTKFALPTSGTTSSPDSVLVFQTYSVTGKVVDPTGKPVSGVTFTLSNSAGSRTAATNTKGEALFSDLGAASFTLAPIAQSGFTFAPTKASVKMPTTGTHNVSPNAVVSFTRTPKTTTSAVSGSGSSSAGEG